MAHIKFRGIEPVDFRGLKIADLTSENKFSASVAHIEVASQGRHDRARSVKSDKFYVCLEGTLVFEVGGEELSIEPGDLVVVPKDEWFSYRNHTEKIATLILIHVPPFDLAAEEFRT